MYAKYGESSVSAKIATRIAPITAGRKSRAENTFANVVRAVAFAFAAIQAHATIK